MAANNFENTYRRNLIYVFEIQDAAHQGKLKVGKASIGIDTPSDQLCPNCHALNVAAKARIDAYTQTAGIKYKLLHTELAERIEINSNGEKVLKAFKDTQVHQVLENSNIKRVRIDETTGQEWFEVDIETVRRAISAVKKGKATLSPSGKILTAPIIFRPEQEDCINQAVKWFKKEDRFLINAKMRYGKTFVGLEIVKRLKFKKTIIVTHRPVVNAGWYVDFQKIFAGKNFEYGSKGKASLEQLLSSDCDGFVYFASIQDLRESKDKNGRFVKNQKIFEEDWDCVIVDEAHEGTKTPLGDTTIKDLIKNEGPDKTTKNTKLLALSGTPFNILDDYDEKSIYTWDYIMEQEAKSGWDKNHFGDANPYDDLPELKIYTYDLGKSLKLNSYITIEDKAFNFREFFRTWTGDIHKDHEPMPNSAQIGDFVHENDVRSFLNLMTQEDPDSAYPFANDEYRDLFRHTYWMIPGVEAGRALTKLLRKHPVFGSGAFEIVNVAGDGNVEDKNGEALQMVQNAIKRANKINGYTITLSCGKLSTGVTVPEWTGVFYLAGSFSTSASSYLQTIFRVQSPANINGKVKSVGYVFDFAPDRTLKMIAESVKISSRAGKTTNGDTKILGKFLNYCPVISIRGSQMKPYNTSQLLQQLKRAYADRVVRNGFDDNNLYNDELLKLTEIEVNKFNDLKKIVEKSSAANQTNKIDINKTGLTDEEFEEKERLEKKKRQRKELTEEEQKTLEQLKKAKEQRSTAISILRQISIRMPLLIYGAEVPFSEDIDLKTFVELVDDTSWNEFMPIGVTKSKFKEFQKYYDNEVFIVAGKKIRSMAKEADLLLPAQRVAKIANLFSLFKNPDKETVLTPWRVVNMHLSDTLGGWTFFDSEFTKEVDQPRLVIQENITEKIFKSENAKFLEINSKTGLYPLFVAYSLFRYKLDNVPQNEQSIEIQYQIWKTIVKNNIFIMCKTPMAKSITKRTLLGYRTGKVNAHSCNDLINTLKNKPDLFIKKVKNPYYWKAGGVNEMNFTAIVGNPPYQIMDGGGKGYSAKPVYNLFVKQAKKLKPDYISLITPSRWFSGGKGLDDFRDEMLHDRSIAKIIDYVDNEELFHGVSIVGGVNYFLWDKSYSDDCEVTSIRGEDKTTIKRDLAEHDIFIRNNRSITIINRMKSSSCKKMNEIVYPRNVFGISSDIKGASSESNEFPTPLFSSHKSNSMGISYISPSLISKNHDLIKKFKVIMGKVVPRGGEVGVDPKDGYRVTSTIQVLYPGAVFSDSYLLLASFDSEMEAENFAKYMSLKFPRFLLHETYSSMNISKNSFRFVPFLDYTREWTDNDLYDYFDVTNEERTLIEGMIRPMEYVMNKT